MRVDRIPSHQQLLGLGLIQCVWPVFYMLASDDPTWSDTLSGQRQSPLNSVAWCLRPTETCSLNLCLTSIGWPHPSSVLTSYPQLILKFGAPQRPWSSFTKNHCNWVSGYFFASSLARLLDTLSLRLASLTPCPRPQTHHYPGCHFYTFYYSKLLHLPNPYSALYSI